MVVQTETRVAGIRYNGIAAGSPGIHCGMEKSHFSVGGLRQRRLGYWMCHDIFCSSLGI